MASIDVESLFIQKFTEKYTLNERDLKRAFSRFDTLKNGLLDLNDVEQMFSQLLNGVDSRQVKSFVSTYDLNGDGKISYPEFLDFLTKKAKAPSSENRSGSARSGRNRPNSANTDSRNDLNAIFKFANSQNMSPSQSNNNNNNNNKYTNSYDNEDNNSCQESKQSSYTNNNNNNINNSNNSNNRNNNKQGDNYDNIINDDNQTAAPSDIDNQELYIDENQISDKQLLRILKLYLNNLKSYLIQICTNRNAKMKTKGLDLLSLSSSELIGVKVAEYILKEFQPYLTTDGRTRGNPFLITYPDFCRVLRKVRVPGSITLSPDVLEQLFIICESDTSQGYADPRNLLHLMFIDIDNPSSNGSGNNTMGIQSSDPQYRHQKKGLTMNRTTLNNTNNANSSTKSKEAPPPLSTSVKLLEAVSHFIKGKSRTSLAPPSNLSIEDIKRSNQVPQQDCIREHVYGLTINLNAGHTIYTLPLPPAAYSGRGSAINAKNLSKTSTSSTAIYVAGPVSVLHDLKTHTQQFYEGHMDDITCLDLSVDGVYAATGCVRSTGKVHGAVVHIWRTDLSTPNTSDYDDMNTTTTNSTKPKGQILVLGNGFFERAVNAVKFSPDTKLLCSIGCDDNHRMGIWYITLNSSKPSAQLLVECNALHGLPQDLKWLTWAPGLHRTSYISKDHISNLCDLLCTTGDRHLRIWSFKRPDFNSGPLPTYDVSAVSSAGVSQSLVYKALVIPQATNKNSKLASAPRMYTSAVFIPCADGTCDLASAGSNGVVYLWRKGECMATANVARGGVRCLSVYNDMLFCGGVGGVFKVLDSRTLKPLIGFSTLQLSISSPSSDTLSTTPIPVTASSTPRPLSSARSRSPSITSSRRSSTSSIAPSQRSQSASRLRPSSSSGGVRPSVGGLQRGPPPAGRSNEVDKAAIISYSGEEDTAQEITSISVVAVPQVSGGMSQNASLLAMYVLITTSAGRMIRIDVGKLLGSGSGMNVGASGNGVGSTTMKLLTSHMKTLFFYHIGTIFGLCTASTQDNKLLVTSGDDRRICVWDTIQKKLNTRTIVKKAAVHSVAFDQTTNFIAAGYANGGISIFAYIPLPSSNKSSTNNTGNKGNSSTNQRLFGAAMTLDNVTSEFSHILKEVCYRKDAKENISDLKYTPDNTKVAAGSHDNFIYIYACMMETNDIMDYKCVLRPLMKLAGHSSYITHIDWSQDSQLLQSTCGAYELLCWNVTNGKQYSVIPNSDINWYTQTCPLNYRLLGIWTPYTNGTDINAVDVCMDMNLCVAADDIGTLHFMQYPCIVKHAPRKQYAAHASHVTNVKIFHRTDNVYCISTIGGRDSTVTVWRIQAPYEDNNYETFNNMNNRNYDDNQY